LSTAIIRSAFALPTTTILLMGTYRIQFLRISCGSRLKGKQYLRTEIGLTVSCEKAIQSGNVCRLRSLRRRARIAHLLRIDINDERDKQNEAADKNLQETVDIDVVKAVVEDPEHQ